MPSTVKEYINSLPEERKQVIEHFLKTLKDNLPNGFEEVISYGMPGYVVPHSIYHDGYHCDPSLPLPFIGLASQKNFVALYHMGIYANPELLKWFVGEYPKNGLIIAGTSLSSTWIYLIDFIVQNTTSL